MCLHENCYVLVKLLSSPGFDESLKMTERTSLLQNDNPPRYAFETGVFKERKKRLRQFQLCVCSILTVLLVVGFVATIAFTIHSKYIDSEDSPELDGNKSKDESLSVILSRKWPLPDQNRENGGNPSAEEDPELKIAFIVAREDMAAKDRLEKRTPTLELDTPSYRHQKVMATSEKGMKYARLGYTQEYALKYMIVKKANSSSLDVPLSTCADLGMNYCFEKETECTEREEIFRRYDGQCNNFKHPETYGVAYRPFRRVLPPDYADGLSEPRMSKTGHALPSARTVSLVVHRPYFKDDPKFTVMLAVWGQFLDHDMTATALSVGANGSSISCCSVSGIASESMHPECFPVMLDPLDPYFRYNVTCMEFVRSAPAPRCYLGPREQLNQVTAFIDGSVIYGSDQETARNLRTLHDGLLKMFLTEDNRTLLPISDDERDGCNREEEKLKGRYCFMAGDNRSNENLHLTSMHLIWARQHNLLAERLLQLNPHWNDERIFQEARKIVGSQMQHITYNEFLPILFGPEIMQKFALKPLEKGFYHGYEEKVDPSISNSFAGAAFRFAHSIIPGLMKLLANDSSSPEYVELHRMLFDPFELYQPGELDRTLRGATQTNIEASDTYFSNELKRHLFERDFSNGTKNPKKCGLDLVSLNIQRGRDHGLPGYTKWRRHCKLSVPETFDDLEAYIDSDSLFNIRAIYEDVEDIDLYTGALSEKPLRGSIIGATVTCLLLDQFIRSKNGDRFWYENEHMHGFSESQLQELRKTTLARIICDNSDNVRRIQYHVMERIDENNKNLPCSLIPELDLIHWKDDRLSRVNIPGDEMTVKVIHNVIN